MKKLMTILATSAVILTGCQKAPEGYRKVTVKEDGLSGYIIMTSVFGQDYVPIENYNDSQ